MVASFPLISSLVIPGEIHNTLTFSLVKKYSWASNVAQKCSPEFVTTFLVFPKIVLLSCSTSTNLLLLMFIPLRRC